MLNYRASKRLLAALGQFFCFYSLTVYSVWELESPFFDIPNAFLYGDSTVAVLIKEKLLDLLGKEEEEGSHDENVSTCDPMPNHSETISHTVNVPLQATLGTLEEIAC